MNEPLVMSRRLCALVLTLPLLLLARPAAGAPEPAVGEVAASPWSALPLREIGPAITSGRISDLAIHPSAPHTWIVGVASGGVWRTENAGTSWTPVFDDAGSFSIGAVAIAPGDPLTVWVGTGENNSQRSVAYGDGIYKSIDGGRTFTHSGLERSEHIGDILVDPRDPDVVWVAAQGPLWAGGGERGLYKTIDGGASWQRVLHVSDDTGISDLAFHPQDPDTLYAVAYQRRRHVWTLINGGPESGIWKTTDGGDTFRRLEDGLPDVDLGRIGIATSPREPDTVYAIVEAALDGSGFYRSTDRGESWEKRSDYISDSPQYYNEIVADPHRTGRVFSLDTFLNVSDDGGRTFYEIGESSKHVDNHAMWIDPVHPDHYLVGCDGGVYETYDAARSWRFHTNLPVTQFYKVAVDDREPFYDVFGGTQDNFTLVGPSRTTSGHGILDRHWSVLHDGDGFQARAEPGNPDIVYGLAQYGALVRVDRRTGERTYLQPQPEPGDEPLRWNWDAPLLVSRHAPRRVYFAAQRIFRSDDRGDTWTAISGDLSRGLDRDALPVMGRIQRPDAVAKHRSTSAYGNVVALAESPRREGLLYAGTDDGLVQVSEDGGATWRRVDSFPGVPERAYVRELEPSHHADGRVYAAFDNHKSGDFRPFVRLSEDHGRSWRALGDGDGAGGLAEAGTVYVVAEDPVDPDLLFVGSEWGLWASQDRGATWVRLGGGLPTIQVRDLAIQEREGDLVVGTFGRGIWILDDLSPLRFASRRPLAAKGEARATLFPPRTTRQFLPRLELGYPDKGFSGDQLWAAENPPHGALFTYHLGTALESRAEARRRAEEEAEAGGKEWDHPDLEALRAEADEEAPGLFAVVRDADGDVVRRIAAPTSAGLHRVAWDLRWPPGDPARLTPVVIVNAYTQVPEGPLAPPGSYTVELERRIDGRSERIAGPEPFVVELLATTTLTAADRDDWAAFLESTLALERAAVGASSFAGELADRLALAIRALDDAAAPAPALDVTARELAARVRSLRRRLDGDEVAAARQEPSLPGILERVGYAVDTQSSSTSAPTATSRRAVALASEELTAVLAELREIAEQRLPELEASLESAGAPWTPGRLPSWPPSAR